METKTFFERVCGLAAAIAIIACSDNHIEGKWIRPIPGMEYQADGINLEKGGKASSINMATLQYEKWEKKGNKLILSGKSIGNRVTISYTDTLTIEKLTKNELTLKNGDYTIDYHKQ